MEILRKPIILEPQGVNVIDNNVWTKVSAPMGRASALYPVSPISGNLLYRASHPSNDSVVNTPTDTVYRGLGKRQICHFPGTAADNPFWYVYYDYLPPGAVVGPASFYYTILDVGDEQLANLLAAESQGVSGIANRGDLTLDASTATLIVSANIQRRGLIIHCYSTSTSSAYLLEGDQPTIGAGGVGIEIEPGGTYECFGDTLHPLGVYGTGNDTNDALIHFVEYV